MEKTGASQDVSKDVLHIPAQTKLTPEQIAKAVAHHNHRHPQGHAPETGKVQPQKSAPGKKMR